MNEVIKNYGELKQLINHGDKVTLDGKLMTSEKVNRMPMAEVRLCIEQGSFKSDPAIEGEFIGKDDKPKERIYGFESDAARQAAMNMTMAERQMATQAYNQLGELGGHGFGGIGGLGQAAMGGLFR